eukprot:1050358-Pelagomonas_calceolata.AAC.2
MLCSMRPPFWASWRTCSSRSACPGRGGWREEEGVLTRSEDSWANEPSFDAPIPVDASGHHFEHLDALHGPHQRAYEEVADAKGYARLTNILSPSHSV